MNRETRDFIIIAVVAVVAIIIVFSGLSMYSGMKRPLTVVESNSMQHADTTSYPGIIDTGDMVVMISPDKKSVVTYVEGYQSGYYKFGSYGDVIIYYREGKNPVIHRAILWLDYEGGKWSAPSLKDYPADLWVDEGLHDWQNLVGKLTLKGLPSKDTTDNFTVDLNVLAHQSGYLTKGDKNQYFDQSTSIHPAPVEKSELKAIAGFEVPWLGCIKLLLNNKNVGMIPYNSVPCLALFLIDLILGLAVIFVIYDYMRTKKETI